MIFIIIIITPQRMLFLLTECMKGEVTNKKYFFKTIVFRNFSCECVHELFSITQ